MDRPDTPVTVLCPCRAIFCARGSLDCEFTRKEWERKIEASAQSLREAINPGPTEKIKRQPFF